MKKNKIILLSLLILALAISCNKSNDKEVKKELDTTETISTNSIIDWQGTYRGVIPCASCEGIETIIVLKSDTTYEKSERYLGEKAQIFIQKGKFEYIENESKIILNDENTKQFYLLLQDALIMLDPDGNRNTGELADDYILQKKR